MNWSESPALQLLLKALVPLSRLLLLQLLLLAQLQR